MNLYSYGLFIYFFPKVLYLKEVDSSLALVCLCRAENFRKKSLINYNISCLKKALRELIRPTVDKVR